MASEEVPGPLLGRGRTSDVFDLGDGRVLRRNRDGASTEAEARIMRHVRAHGYPVPEVHDADGGDLVMARVAGPTMLDAFPSSPWKGPQWARLLARLHHRLAEVPAPDFDLPTRVDPPEVLMHGDLHPDNVLLTVEGPMVIDWPNAGLGARGADVASTWLIVAASNIEASGFNGLAQRAGRATFVRGFLRHAGRDEAKSVLARAAERRLRDRNVLPAEIERIHALLRREGLQ